MSPAQKGEMSRRHFALMDPIADVIALDGPAGSGKGTAAKSIAELLGYHLLDSGALYRVVALQALDTSTSITEEELLVDFALYYRPRFDSAGRVYLKDREVTRELRHSVVEALTPKVEQIPAVRKALLESQLSYRRMPGLVTDGRDQAEIFSRQSEAQDLRTFAFYVDAEPEVRGVRIAQRRLALGDRNVNVAKVIKDLIAPDNADATRPVSPLVMHPKAVRVDTTSMSPEQVVGFIISRYREEKKRRGV